MNQKIAFFLFILSFLVGSFAETTYYCNSTSPCPEEYPCCDEYGVCGTGAYCLGGCDIRYSYNLTACMPMPRMSNFTTDFTSTDLLENEDTYLGNASATDWIYSGYIAINDDALLLQMPNQSSGTVISSTKYLWYGKVSTTLKSSHDDGVITAFILFSDVQDEIDWEFVGYNLTFPETNFYYQGIDNYTNARDVETTDTFTNYHVYEVDWQEDFIKWSIDGVVVRTLEKADTYNATADIYQFPQTPSRIQFSLWPGGSSSSIGTIEWAGGEVNWTSTDMEEYGYYYAYFKNITVEAYPLPDDVLLVGSDDEADLHAFLYNSTDGYQSDVYLTNATTWLGSEDATGLDPDNDSSSSESSSATSSSSKSKSKTTGSVATTDTNTSSSTTTAAFTGDNFVQNTGDTSTSSTNIANKLEGLFGITSGIALGFYMLLY